MSKFSSRLLALTMGDPMDEKTNYGPMARLDLAIDLRKQVQGSISNGAKVADGSAGHQQDINGAFFRCHSSYRSNSGDARL